MKLKACNLEYDTTNGESWKVTILAYNMNDAMEFVRKKVPNLRSFSTVGVAAEIDIIDENTYKDFSRVEEVEKTVVVEKVVEKEVLVSDSDNQSDMTEDGRYRCHWCDKSFKSTKNLLSHIKKFHIE